MDLAGVLLAEADRLAGAGGGEDLVALGFQSAAGQAPDGLFVLDDEDRLGSADERRVHRRRVGPSPRASSTRGR